MKVLILGGTGAIGSYLVQLLSEKNTVYVTSRSAHTSKKNIFYIQGNAHDNAFLKQVLNQYSRFDAIVDFMVYKTDEFRNRYELILENTDHYLFFSSSTVYADAQGRLTEKCPRHLEANDDEHFINMDTYPISKAHQEDILNNSKYKNYTIIRPYITYATERLQLGTLEKEYWLYRALHGRTIVFSKDVASHVTTMTYGYDVAYVISKLIGNKKALSQVVHITGSESKKWSDVILIYLDQIEKCTGIRPKVLLRDNSAEIMKLRNQTFGIKYDRLYDRYFDNSKINAICECKFDFTSMEDGLSKCIYDFVQKPRFKEISCSWEAWCDKVCHERTSLREFKTYKDKIKYLIFRYTPVLKWKFNIN